jgi:hypothetical protein
MRPTLAVVGSLTLAATTSLPAQRLADRVAAVREGTVTFRYAARPEVCGDGPTIIIRELGPGTGFAIYSPDGLTIGDSWNGRPPVCVHGPAHVRLAVRNRAVVAVRPFMGETGGMFGATDLGSVNSAEAAAYFLQLARTATEEMCYTAMIAAAIADSARISAPLLAIAQDRSLRPANREQALKWLARTAPREGNTAAEASVRAIAADQTDVPDVRERAIRVLTHPTSDAFLRDLYGRLTPALKERVIRVVAESDTPENLAWIARVAENEAEAVDLRDRAIRVLGEELHQTDRLRALYPRLATTDLKDRVIRVVAADADAGAIRWLRTLAVTATEPLEARDRALRVLGEQGEVEYLREVYARLDRQDLQERVLRELGERGGSENTRFLRGVALDPQSHVDLRDRSLRMLAEAGLRSADLAALYDTIAVADLRARLINLLAERGDDAARDKLDDIARRDPDPDLRNRAAKRLAEAH